MVAFHLPGLRTKTGASSSLSSANLQQKEYITRGSTGTATVQEHNQQVSRQYKPSNSTRTQSAGQYRPSNSTRTQSAGQQTVQAKQQYKYTISRSADLQAKQQYKNTISRSADSTSQATVQEHSQATVQEHKQQVSRQYKPSNSTRTQSAGQQTVQAKQQYRNTKISNSWQTLLSPLPNWNMLVLIFLWAGNLENTTGK